MYTPSFLKSFQYSVRRQLLRMSYVYFRESVSGGWDKEGAVKGRRERVEGRQTLQYSWLALYVSHKLAGELPLSDSLTEHTLFPARIVSSLHYSLLTPIRSSSTSPSSSFPPCYPPSSFSENKSL